MVSNQKNIDFEEIDVKVLKHLASLSKPISIIDLANTLKEDQSAVMRSILKLSDAGLVKVQEADRILIKLTKYGEKAKSQNLPECLLVDYLKNNGEIHIKDLNIEMKDIAIAWAKKKGLIEIDKGVVKLLRDCDEQDMFEKQILEKISKEEHYSLDFIDEKHLDLLKKRRFIEVEPKTVRYVSLTPEGKSLISDIRYEEKIGTLTPEMLVEGSWKGKKFKKYDVYAQSYDIYSGKEHFVNQAINYIRQIWLDMGFEEMQGPMLTKAFWNFDALFVPQDHPAREMQDTFYVDFADDEQIPSKFLQAVKKMHEKGDSNSEGWGYVYDVSKANEYVLRTHTTVLSALKLAELSLDDLPKKYFAIGKVFRNETLDWKHLFEFFQVEGIVVDENVNFSNLLAYLKEFFLKMGYPNIRIRPAYFPYTELSLEVEVLIPNKGWTELGGAGIFRPEVVKPLLGEEIPVLAWGLGLERIIMQYYGFKDIRDSYTSNLNVLRKSKRWLL